VEYIQLQLFIRLNGELIVSGIELRIEFSAPSILLENTFLTSDDKDEFPGKLQEETDTDNGLIYLWLRSIKTNEDGLLDCRPNDMCYFSSDAHGRDILDEEDMNGLCGVPTISALPLIKSLYNEQCGDILSDIYQDISMEPSEAVSNGITGCSSIEIYPLGQRLSTYRQQYTNSALL
jgi:hypothetical protein